MRAAGRTLTIGELDESYRPGRSLYSQDPVIVVTADGTEVPIVAADGGRRDLRLVVKALPRDSDLDEQVLDFLVKVATAEELDAIDLEAARLAKRLGLVE